MGTPAQPYFPQVDKEVDPKITVHLQRIYPTLNDHNQAIVLLKSQLTDLSTTVASKTTSTVTEIITSSSATSSIGLVNNQQAVTSYTAQQSDYGGFILLSDASPIAVTLPGLGDSPAISIPWYTNVINSGAGLATLTPTAGTINGNASFALYQNEAVTVAFDGTNYWTYPLLAWPQNTPAVTHEWLNSYSSTTGAFTQTQPAVTDVTGAAPIASPTFTTKATVPVLDLTAAQTTVAGSSSGSAVFSQPFQGTSYKKVVINLAALNGTAAYSYPTAFSVTPDYFIGGAASGATVTAISITAVTVTGITSTGVVILEGY